MLYHSDTALLRNIKYCNWRTHAGTYKHTLNYMFKWLFEQCKLDGHTNIIFITV